MQTNSPLVHLRRTKPCVRYESQHDLPPRPDFKPGHITLPTVCGVDYRKRVATPKQRPEDDRARTEALNGRT